MEQNWLPESLCRFSLFFKSFKMLTNLSVFCHCSWFQDELSSDDRNIDYYFNQQPLEILLTYTSNMWEKKNQAKPIEKSLILFDFIAMQLLYLL